MARRDMMVGTAKEKSLLRVAASAYGESFKIHTINPFCTCIRLPAS